MMTIANLIDVDLHLLRLSLLFIIKNQRLLAGMRRRSSHLEWIWKAKISPKIGTKTKKWAIWWAGSEAVPLLSLGVGRTQTTCRACVLVCFVSIAFTLPFSPHYPRHPTLNSFSSYSFHFPVLFQLIIAITFTQVRDALRFGWSSIVMICFIECNIHF